MSIIALWAALSLAQTAASPAQPSTPTDWESSARIDIEAGYALMRDNHPGWVNPEDPGFRATLEAARVAGLEAAAAAHDRSGYRAALAAFSTVLGDGHAGLNAVAAPGKTTVRWPGFLAAWRGDRMLVVDGEAAPGIGIGSEILSCDGTPIADLLVQRLAPRAVRLHEAGQWWAYGSRVLTDGPQVGGEPPQRCTFRTAGAVREVTLSYGPVPGDFSRRYWTANNGGYSEIALAEPRPGLFVIGVPTSAPGAEGVAAYQQLVKEIAARHATLAKGRAVVLDLRFNQGGSSSWARNIAKALWGERAVTTRNEKRNRLVEIWWRNSPGNIAYLEGIDGELRGNGQAAIADEIAALAKRMTSDLAAGKPLTVEEPADLSSPAPVPAPAMLKAPVYVIVPGQCASACLDALDDFTLFENVTLVGAPSSGDSLYMDIRHEKLPSGEAEAIIPLKVWQHRPRGGGEIYRPRIELRQADWSIGAFLDAIEADLSKRDASR